jgi:hypothetical protein
MAENDSSLLRVSDRVFRRRARSHRAKYYCAFGAARVKGMVLIGRVFCPKSQSAGRQTGWAAASPIVCNVRKIARPVTRVAAQPELQGESTSTVLFCLAAL